MTGIGRQERSPAAVASDGGAVTRAMPVTRAVPVTWHGHAGPVVTVGVDTVLELVDVVVDRHPHAPSIWEAGRTVTYAELDRLADRAAKRLRRDHGVAVGDVVLIAAEAGIAFTAAVLGVLRCGGAFLPVDLSYPEKRKAHILQVARAKLAVHPAGTRAPGPGPATTVETLLAGDEADDPQPASRPALGPHDISYLIFSSGSTGAPKCIVQTHGCLLNFVAWQVGGSGLGTGRRVLQAAPLTFDVSVQEIFFALASGGCLFVPQTRVRRDPRDLLDFAIAHGIEVVDFPQSLIDAIMRLPRTFADAPALRHIISAGETVRCDGELAGLLARRPELTLHNHYGPAENHMATSHSVSAPRGNIEPRPPVGSPIWNVYVYVLDENQQPVPDGQAGEVYIGGAGVGRGYTDPSRTAAAFVDDPFLPGRRLYRTRDRGRWRTSDGTLELLGRMDDLLKIRGNGVDPLEVEAHLAAVPGVSAAMVFPHDRADGTRELHAVLTGDLPPADQLRAALTVVLPDYTVPVCWWSAQALPTTPNGKLDRSARPQTHEWRPIGIGGRDGAARAGVESAQVPIRHPHSDGGLAEAWIPRLAEVRGVPGLEPHAPSGPYPRRGQITAADTAALDRLTGGQAIGVHLVAIAATHLVLAAWNGNERHGVLAPAPRPGRAAEFAVVARVDPLEPVAELLSRVHVEFERCAPAAWPDRTGLSARLVAVGLPELAEMTQVAVVFDGAFVPPSAPGPAAAPPSLGMLTLTVRRIGDGLVVEVTAPGGSVPLAAEGLAPAVAAAMASIAADPRLPCGDIVAAVTSRSQRNVS